MSVELVRAPYAFARALAATILVMTGATAAHTWAGGHLPGLPALLALSGVLLGAGLLVLRGLVPSALLLPVVLVAQTGLHGMFGLLATPAGHAAGHGAQVAAGADPALWSWSMLAAHAASTLLTAAAWWLCRRSVHTLVTVLALRPAYAGGRRDPLPARRAAAPVRSLVHLLATPRRGPPVALRHA